MKRYIKSAAQFKNAKGTSKKSNIRKGIYTFGKGIDIPLAGDCKIHLSTGYVRFDTSSHEFSLSLNIEITGTGVYQYYQALTAEEFKQLYEEISQMNEDELHAEFSVDREYDTSLF